MNMLGSRAITEAGITVRHANFTRNYFIDLLVDHGAIFELKTVSHLHDGHRAQLMNCLLLTECCHGKLINFRPERIEHEFVNTTLTSADRVNFDVDHSAWDASMPRVLEIRCIVVELMRDWGTGQDALTHFLGGEDRVFRKIDVLSNGRCIGQQKMRVVEKDAAFKFTAFSDSLESFESHALKFLKHTDLKCFLWINVTLGLVTMKTLTKRPEK